MKLINIVSENPDGVLMGTWLFDDFDQAEKFMKRHMAYQPSLCWYALLFDTDVKNGVGAISSYEIGDDPNKIKNFK